MRTIKLNIFKFEELSKEAQEVAKKNVEFEQYDSDLWLCARAAQKLYDMLKIDYVISGNRLRTWIVNNILPYLTSTKYYGRRYGKDAKFRYSKIFSEVDACNLTGVCFDYDFLGPLMEFVDNPDEQVDNYQLARTNLNSIIRSLIDAERDYFYSDEGFSEHCEANDMEFLQNGVAFSAFTKELETTIF